MAFGASGRDEGFGEMPFCGPDTITLWSAVHCQEEGISNGIFFLQQAGLDMFASRHSTRDQVLFFSVD